MRHVHGKRAELRAGVPDRPVHEGSCNDTLVTDDGRREQGIRRRAGVVVVHADVVVSGVVHRAEGSVQDGTCASVTAGSAQAEVTAVASSFLCSFMISPFRWWLFVWDRPRTADSPWANSTCYGDLRASSPLRRRNGLSAYWERIHFTRALRSASGTLELGGIGTCPHTPWPPFFTLSISLARS